jgi:phage head maturation protease
MTHDLVREIDLSTFTVRSVEDAEHEFAGWACRTDTIDAYGTLFRPGCWSAGGLDDGVYALCWFHNPSQPVGVFEASERSEGLWIEGDWDDTPEGRTARTRGQERGSARQLSVGFRGVIYAEDAPNEIVAARLVEVSQITARMAAVPGAEFRSAAATDHRIRIARSKLLLTQLGR